MKSFLFASGVLAAMLLASGASSAQSTGDESESGVSRGVTMSSGSRGYFGGSMRNGGEGGESGIGSSGTTGGNNSNEGARASSAAVVLTGYDIYAPRYGYYGATYHYGKNPRCYTDDTSVNFSGHYCNSRDGGIPMPNDDSDDRGQ